MLGVRTNPSADNLIHATHANPSQTAMKGSSIKNWNGNWSEWTIERHHGAYILPHMSELMIDPTLFLQEGNAQLNAVHVEHIAILEQVLVGFRSLTRRGSAEF